MTKTDRVLTKRLAANCQFLVWCWFWTLLLWQNLTQDALRRADAHVCVCVCGVCETAAGQKRPVPDVQTAESRRNTTEASIHHAVTHTHTHTHTHARTHARTLTHTHASPQDTQAHSRANEDAAQKPSVITEQHHHTLRPWLLFCTQVKFTKMTFSLQQDVETMEVCFRHGIKKLK